MNEHNYIAVEFPDDLSVIQELRSVSFAFSEICDDLELMGRELAQHSSVNSGQSQDIYLDACESYQALRRESDEYLHRSKTTTTQQKLTI